MKLKFEFNGQPLECDLLSGTSLAIDLAFGGPQPSYFDAAAATATPVSGDGFVGSVAQGFCCNFDTLQMIPHCNGTHTETVGHIVRQVSEVPIANVLNRSFYPAVLITVEPQTGSSEEYRPALAKTDRVISKQALAEGIEKLGLNLGPISNSDFGLVIRTLPNNSGKKSAVYSGENPPPFFTATAMKWIADLGVKHLLVDVPSVDRANDEGKLTNHHLFWNVEEGSSELIETAYRERTITEMIFVPDELLDGVYGMDLQVPAMMIDAAPSRPVLFKSKVS